MQLPVSTSQTLIDVSSEPLTTWIPSNWKTERIKSSARHFFHSDSRLNVDGIYFGLKNEVPVGTSAAYFVSINKLQIKLIEMNEFY